jgi:hypothetical protein
MGTDVLTVTVTVTVNVFSVAAVDCTDCSGASCSYSSEGLFNDLPLDLTTCCKPLSHGCVSDHPREKEPFDSSVSFF